MKNPTIDTGEIWNDNKGDPLEDIKTAIDTMKKSRGYHNWTLLPNGCIISREEFKRYYNFKPSVLQRIIWFFWSTKFSMHWNNINKLKKKV